jgi:hypothetical protein
MVGSLKFVAAGARNSRGDSEDTARNESPRSGAFLSSGPYWSPGWRSFRNLQIGMSIRFERKRTAGKENVKKA